MSRAEFYRLVSAALRRARIQALNEGGDMAAGVERAALELEDAFAKHNTKFDAVRFRHDIGIL
jgi:hypothetical protein